jgi:hypothetical protein
MAVDFSSTTGKNDLQMRGIMTDWPLFRSGSQLIDDGRSNQFFYQILLHQDKCLAFRYSRLSAHIRNDSFKPLGIYKPKKTAHQVHGETLDGRRVNVASNRQNLPA